MNPDAVAIVRRFWELMASNDFTAVGAVLADDFVLEWPQTRERLRGRENFARMNAEYPAQGRWRFEIHRLFGDATQVASDVGITDGVLQARALSFFTVEAGRVRRIVEFWPEPYPAPANRAHLVEAIGMSEAVTVARADPGSPDARALMDELSDVLAAITGSSGRASFDAADVAAPRACFAIARDAHGRAIGCGAFRPLEASIAEVKRMYARPGTTGVGSAVLRFLEAEAARLDFAALWLETRLVNTRAVTFYERRGYARIANYGRYAGNPAAACFAKTVAARAVP